MIIMLALLGADRAGKKSAHGAPPGVMRRADRDGSRMLGLARVYF